jgi:hypothetical protein
MIALFFAAAFLLIAVIDAALFDSDQRERSDEERGQLMEDIARWRMVCHVRPQSTPAGIYSLR